MKQVFALLLALVVLLGCVSIQGEKPPLPPKQPSPETLERQAEAAKATELSPETISSIAGVDVSDDLEQSIQDLDEASQ
ncbi:MAG TPA: hypothetical protein HA252_01655 [Candidatus Diapherotrites archaeon]|uniref:Uncharacterized protein n=1 Tax=Candidatus Iainarchaeum sp. TaxID=3101447 RepID=A0A7J4JHN2_9ARCH|nr:hypothetical protein [Candidatus Diapherotrites archaeon]HIH16089.1 hypothetical protein [Candidatus Diapherotrites archaeon]